MRVTQSALLVMDVQRGIVERYATSANVLKPFQTAIDAARGVNMPIVYVRVAFRAGYPEVSPNNRSFSAIAGHGGFTELDDATSIHPAVAPEPGDITVVKRRVSAFSGSDLDVVLRALQVDTLVLTGIATSGVVLSTLRQAADLDYHLKVLSDACLDGDSEVHAVLTQKVFPRQAEVLTSDAFAEAVRREH